MTIAVFAAFIAKVGGVVYALEKILLALNGALNQIAKNNTHQED